MRKISANYVFTGLEFIKNGLITLDDNGVICSVRSLGEGSPEEESTEFYNGILCPGFVNTHSHLELSHMLRKIEPHKGMAYFCEVIMRTRDWCDQAAQLDAIRKYDKEMFLEGIVAVGDISNSTHSFAVKSNSKIYYHTYIECLGLSEDKSEEIIKHALMVEQQAINLNLNCSITGHAPYSMSENLLRDALFHGNRKKMMSLHNQESFDEIELFKNKGGNLSAVFGKGFESFLNQYKSSLERNLRYLEKETKLLLVHNTYTDAKDYEYASNLHPNIYWALCPRSNQYIESRLPDLRMFHAKGAKITLGTDSLSSNHSLSMLEEIKVIQDNFPEIPLSSILTWATLNGANALNIGDKYGSFTVGTSPGVCLIENVDLKNLRLIQESKSHRLLP